jgi:predicted alpha/beta superfamily hydrolase
VTRILLTVLFIASAAGAQAAEPAATDLAPLAIGQTFTLKSVILGETRRINVYAPPGFDAVIGSADTTRLPVLYMPDGGLAEDFLHVAGLVQIGAINGTMRPFLLVGIENTQRRRDLTPPTSDERDLAIAPKVGGSAAFRAFLRDELMPVIGTRYRITGETAIVGESLAGLFAVESFLVEPGLFDTVVAIDPSLWWNREDLVAHAATLLAARDDAGGTLWMASSNESDIAAAAAKLAAQVTTAGLGGVRCLYQPLPAETHLTIYHPAALLAFRAVFAPASGN